MLDCTTKSAAGECAPWPTEHQGRRTKHSNRFIPIASRWRAKEERARTKGAPGDTAAQNTPTHARTDAVGASARAISAPAAPVILATASSSMMHCRSGWEAEEKRTDYNEEPNEEEAPPEKSKETENRVHE